MKTNSHLKLIAFFTGVLLCFICCKDSEDKNISLRISSVDNLEGYFPVSLEIGENLNNDIVLMKKVEGESQEIPFQIDETNKKLWFLSNSIDYASSGTEYYINKGPGSNPKKNILQAKKKHGNLQLSINDKPLVQYRYEMTYPPEGVDSIFRKSGYIHPLITPGGDTLTRIQPPDHWHHYGLWGPWTHTQVNGERVDFWNLGEGMGTVLFKEFKNTTSGNVFASFEARQEHIDFKTAGEARIALNEDLEVTLWNLNKPEHYMLDYTTRFSSPLENGILFEAYRYGGGIGLRFNERWKADNCSVLTSEGKDRLTADGSNARWCIVSGESLNGSTNGILFMSHPKNRMHPEPMRIWPIDANEGRGDMFFEFCPIRHEEWKIEPSKNYELKYRMVVFDGELKAEEAEAYWQAFAKRPSAMPISK